jgi:transcriptional regulator with XRE-family HTH domain
MKYLGRRGATNIDKHIGHRLRARRMMLHMTQTDLAKLLGVTFQQLQKYEKGTNRLRASTLPKLASALNVPIVYFFEGAPTEHADLHEPKMAWTEFLATHDGLALFESFRSIENKSLRRAVVDLVKRMGQLSHTNSSR